MDMLANMLGITEDEASKSWSLFSLALRMIELSRDSSDEIDKSTLRARATKYWHMAEIAEARELEAGMMVNVDRVVVDFYA